VIRAAPKGAAGGPHSRPRWLAPVSRRPRPACALASQVVRADRPDPDGTPSRPAPGAPRVCPRCPRLFPLWRPAARYRHRPGPPRRPGHPRPLRRSGAPSRLALPHPPRPQSGRLLARSGPRSLTLAPLHPLHPRLGREPVAAQDRWGPASALDADPRLRPLDRAVPGPPPGLTGEAGLPRRRPPRGGGVNRSYAPRN
jgi:hypothetical protein